MQLQIFKPGAHSGALMPKVLAHSAAVYDPKTHEAPLVVGHPKHDAPAHGWVAALNFDEGEAATASEGKASASVRDFLNRLPTQIDYAERSAPSTALNGGRQQCRYRVSLYLVPTLLRGNEELSQFSIVNYDLESATSETVRETRRGWNRGFSRAKSLRNDLPATGWRG